jgi:sugar phosphate permease
MTHNPPLSVDVESAGLADAQPTRVRWHIVALLMAFSFMSWFNRVCMAIAGDDRIMPEYGISEEMMGTIYSAFFFAYTICMTPGGWVADRFGAKAALTIMGLGSGLWVAYFGVAGLTIHTAAALVVALLCGRALMGVFTAPIYPSSGRIIAHWFPLRKCAGTNGLVQGFAGLGNASSYLVFGWLVAQLDWPVAFLITGAVTALLALVWAVYARNRPSEHPRTNAAERALADFPASNAAAESATDEAGDTALWRLLRNRSLVFLTLSYVAVGYFEYLFIFWTHYYYKDVLKLGDTRSKLYAGIAQAGFAIGMVSGGWLCDWLIQRIGFRWGRALVPLFGMTASAVFLLLAMLRQEPAWIVTCIALANGAVGMTEGPVWATAIELGGRNGATAAGICNTGGNAGGMIAPIVTPWLGNLLTPRLGKALAWQVAIGVAGGLCLVGVSLWFWIDASQGRDQGTPESDKPTTSE